MHFERADDQTTLAVFDNVRQREMFGIMAPRFSRVGGRALMNTLEPVLSFWFGYQDYQEKDLQVQVPNRVITQVLGETVQYNANEIQSFMHSTNEHERARGQITIALAHHFKELLTDQESA